ncbi:phosphoglycolate phosphatase [Alkalibacillus flavidus]|uniref:Phosphoglycolate phosphatase n=1 Tax=Alkalibacillus flavidus TaxID=546021 RepID=A0ABV2L0M5_9BACI
MTTITIITVEGKRFDTEAILFDKDGTLINFYSIWGVWGDLLTKEIAIQIPETINYDPHHACERIGLDIVNQTWDPVGPLAIGNPDDSATILTHYLYQLGIPWDEAVTYLTKSLENIESTIDWKQYIKPIDGLIEFINEANQQQIKMAVVTADSTQNALYHLQLLGIDHYFDTVIGFDSVTKGKPFPEMAYTACQRLLVSPQQTILFGDSNGDMTLAKNAKLKAGIGIAQTSIDNAFYLRDTDLVIQDYRGCYIN